MQPAAPATGRVLLAHVLQGHSRPLDILDALLSVVNNPNAFTAAVPTLADSNVGLLGMHLREPAAAPDVRGLRNT